MIVRAFIQNTPQAKTKEDLSTWSLMAAGACAGMSYNAILFPADSIKSRQQASDVQMGFMQTARELYRTQGTSNQFM